MFPAHNSYKEMNKKFEKAKADAREKVLGALPKDMEEIFEKAFDLGYDIGYLHGKSDSGDELL